MHPHKTQQASAATAVLKSLRQFDFFFLIKWFFLSTKIDCVWLFLIVLAYIWCQNPKKTPGPIFGEPVPPLAKPNPATGLFHGTDHLPVSHIIFD